MFTVIDRKKKKLSQITLWAAYKSVDGWWGRPENMAVAQASDKAKEPVFTKATMPSIDLSAASSSKTVTILKKQGVSEWSGVQCKALSSCEASS